MPQAARDQRSPAYPFRPSSQTTAAGKTTGPWRSSFKIHFGDRVPDTAS